MQNRPLPLLCRAPFIFQAQEPTEPKEAQTTSWQPRPSRATVRAHSYSGRRDSVVEISLSSSKGVSCAATAAEPALCPPQPFPEPPLNVTWNTVTHASALGSGVLHPKTEGAEAAHPEQPTGRFLWMLFLPPVEPQRKGNTEVIIIPACDCVCSYPQTHFTGPVRIKGHTLCFPTALSTHPLLWELCVNPPARSYIYQCFVNDY